tara:strand:- start:300 stop:692 length:393 start_codon:yes stop_codon:yes gene_type:complete
LDYYYGVDIAFCEDKKKIISVIMLYMVKFNISNINISYLMALITGFVIAYFVNYRAKTAQAVYLILDKSVYHIHHWMFLSVLILAMVVYKNLPHGVDYIFIAFLVGVILEDGLYSDVFKIKTDPKDIFKK